MKATLSFGVEVSSPQKLTALRDTTAKQLADDPDVEVISTNSAVNDSPFTVFGSIKGQPDQSYRTVVLAQDADEAKAAALKEDDKRTVVAVLSGDVPPA